MNITERISELFPKEVQEIISNNPEIQFYANDNIHAYMWRDSRFKDTQDMFQNKGAETRRELVEIFLSHLKNKQIHFQR